MPESSVGAPFVAEQSFNNPNLGVNMFFGGVGLADPRIAYRYGAASNVTYGFLGTTRIPVIDQVPSTHSTTAIAAGQNVTTGPLTLVSSSSGTTGITVLGSALVVQPSGNSIPANTIAIDGVPGIVNFGSTTTISLYDPTKALARAINVASNSNDSSSGVATVHGYDIYGYPMTEAISLSNAGTATGKKAFKFVSSIIISGTINSTSISAGQSDVYGFPIRVDEFANVEVYWGTNNNLITANNTGTFAFAVTTTANTTTGDVRGTYSTSTASNSTLKMQIFCTPSVADILSFTGSYPSGLFGVSQA